MDISRLQNLISAADRYKLFCCHCHGNQLASCIENLKELNIPVVDLGYELAQFIAQLEDFSYLAIDSYDHLVKLLNERASRSSPSEKGLIAIYNLGILLESDLEIDAVQLLKNIAQSIPVLIVWDGVLQPSGHLSWTGSQDSISYDFSSLNIKIITNEV